MESSVAVVGDMLADMSKSKRNGKKDESSHRKTTRVNVGVPEEWHAVARRIAAKRCRAAGASPFEAAATTFGPCLWTPWT